MKFEISQRFKY